MGPTKSPRTPSESSELWGHGTMSSLHSDVNSELEPSVQSQGVRRESQDSSLTDRPSTLTDLGKVRVPSGVDFSPWGLSSLHSPLSAPLALYVAW